MKLNHFTARERMVQRFHSSYGWDRERSLQVAEAAIASIRDLYGGNRVYIQKRNGEDRKKIQEEFNGRNIDELSRKYAVSARTVRNYVKR